MVKGMFRKISWDWLPLSMLIFIVYMIQRGLAALAKTDMVVPWLKDGLGIYFTTASLTALLMGFVSDRVRPLILMGLSLAVGLCGIAGLMVSPWMFGILFGVAAASFKVLSYSAPLKNKTTNVDALRIAPQASAKNFGAALFLLLVGGIIAKFGFVSFTIILSILFGGIGLWSTIAVRNHKPTKSWEWKRAVELVKKSKFWGFMIYCGVMVGLYYLTIMGFIPAMLKVGLSKATALSILGLTLVGAGLCRWPLAWLGERIGHWKVMIGGTLGIGLSMLITPLNPILATLMFAPFASAHTPNYWTVAKKEFGSEYLGTVLGLGYVAMYLGAGVLYGKW